MADRIDKMWGEVYDEVSKPVCTEHVWEDVGSKFSIFLDPSLKEKHMLKVSGIKTLDDAKQIAEMLLPIVLRIHSRSTGGE